MKRELSASDMAPLFGGRTAMTIIASGDPHICMPFEEIDAQMSS